ncbi:hypothetical protein [Tautonia sociabilis]|uniref:Uncharacterized protein n=1 Tax=Tautonia sociabilis TaxID=2080755 RepID=A0A432MDL4_9BACT|nr:hypothetical protein [Tautonia sociabilis]RUL82930.1 hypothetical protein TsocGM_23020 [Tautonia sociabilis]
MGAMFRCGACGQKYANRPSLAGRKVRCRSCGAMLRVPGLPGGGTDRESGSGSGEQAEWVMELDEPGPAPSRARRTVPVPPPPDGPNTWRPRSGGGWGHRLEHHRGLLVGLAAGAILTAVVLGGVALWLATTTGALDVGRSVAGAPSGEIAPEAVAAAPEADPIPPGFRPFGGPLGDEEPTMDASTLAAAQASLAEMRLGLTPEQEQDLADDIAAIAMAEGLRVGADAMLLDPLAAFRLMDGMTREEISQLADRLRPPPGGPIAAGPRGPAPGPEAALAEGPKPDDPEPDEPDPEPAPDPAPAPAPGPKPPLPAAVSRAGFDPNRHQPLPLPEELATSQGDRLSFREVGPPGGLLVGARVGYVDAFGGGKVGAIRPIYRIGDRLVESRRSFGSRDIIGAGAAVARPGYAVGAIETKAGLLLDAFRFVFMRIDGDGLDPADWYRSDWLGDPGGGGPGAVSGDGKLVIGLIGLSNGREINALGLVVAEEPMAP